MFDASNLVIAASGGGGLLPDFMSPQGQVLLWTIIVFIVLLALLWKFAWGPIMHALEQREHNIQARIDEAEKKFKEAEARMAEYEKRIAGAKDEAAAIIAEGKRDVEKVKEDIIKQANDEAGKQIERAKRDIELARQAAVADLRDKMVQLTAELTTQVIEREINSDDHKRFISESVQKLEKVS
ncbi:MAG TPA: F0F1 ATP synthase subunit B [Planctomycetota bacterium]|nr:F0F1 ATP synthase subunit B [Planctomycetota bacterium]